VSEFVRAGGISLHPDRLSGLLAATLFVLAGSSGCLLAGVVGTGGWGAIRAPGRWQRELAVLRFKVGRRFRNGGFLEATSALTERCSRPRYRAAAELEL
jgi:hypothetical protein